MQKKQEGKWLRVQARSNYLHINIINLKIGGELTMGIMPCNTCGSVIIGDGVTLQSGGQVTCGASQLIFEADGRCVTITGQGQINLPSQGAIPCNAVLEFETCNGQVIRKVLPNPVPPQTGIQTPAFTVACVRRLTFRCEQVPEGVGCIFNFRYAVSFCEQVCSE